jgi:chromosome segregation ATPase
MAQFEEERRAYYEQQLQEYREELEAERVALQADIDRLRSEYNSRLEQLERERQEIIAEYEAREAELRQRLEQRTQVLQNVQTATGADFESAQQELAQLSRQQERIDAVEDQVVGQVDRIRQAIAQGDVTTARARIESLRSYLQQDSVASIQELSGRRAADLFLLDRLEALLEQEIEAEQRQEERSLLDELQLVSQVRRLSEQDSDAAREQLIATIPEVQSAHNALVDRAVGNAQERIRDTAVSRMDEASGLVAAGDYTAALSAYDQALAVTAPDTQSTQTMIGDLLSLGYSVADFTRTGEPVQGGQAIAARADIDLEAERAAFEEQIDEAVAAREEELQAELSELRRSFEEEMDQAIEEREGELQADLARTEEELAELENELASLRGSLDERLEEQEAALREERIAELEALAEEAGTDRANLQQRIEELRTFEERVQSAQAAYRNYLEEEAAARQANPEDPITASRQELNAFLRSEDVRAIFGDLSEQINEIFTATQSAGSSAALADAAEVIASIAEQPTLEASRNLLAFEIEDLEAAGGNENAELLRILRNMQDLLNAAAQ